MDVKGRVQPELFQYVIGYAEQIRQEEYAPGDGLDLDWDIFTFCQLFFDQFFSEFGINISGFSLNSRERAAVLIETLNRAGGMGEWAQELVVLYEQFCDMSDDAQGGYGGPGQIDLLTFHLEYLSTLLDVSRKWAAQEGRDALSTRIADVTAKYEAAIEEVEWLTR